MDFETLANALLDELCASHPMAARPSLVWKSLRVSAGIAYTRRNAIALSRIVLVSEEAVRDTLIHEYAHLLAVHRHGAAGAGHGPAWRQAMHDLGVEPKVYHRYQVERNQKRQVVTYQCTKCGRLIERSRRLPKRRKYMHSDCGGLVKLKSVEQIG